jgi:hypothetical protein
MRYVHFISICILMIAAIGLDLFPAYGGEQSRLLININTQQPLQKNSTTTPKTGGNADILVSLLSKQLLNAGYQVLTTDEIMASRRISETDIQKASHGDIGILRKIGAINSAGYILNGIVQTSISKEDVMGIKMDKAVTILSFKLFETATGNKIEVDSSESIGASRSPSSAMHAAAKKMSQRLTGILTQRIPMLMTTADYERLVRYKDEIEKGTAYIAKTDAIKELADKPVEQKTSEKVKPVEQETSTKVKENGYPQIIIINPPMARGFKVVEKRKTFLLEGQAIDKTGIKRLLINNNPVSVDNEGGFKYKIGLQPGDNNVHIIATNMIGNSTTKRIQMIYPEDKSPPQLTLIHPKISRGFAVIDKSQLRRTRVEGLVKDETGILFLRINDMDVKVLENGHFSYQVPMEKGMDKIVIEAADTVGNLTRKELKVDRRLDGSRKANVSSDQIYSPTSGSKPVFWGLGIGVSRYKSTLVDLKYADDDVLALENFFKTQEGRLFSEVHFKALIDEAVSRESVIKNISTHLGQAAPDDVVFIFLAGHGIKHRQSGSYYFLPYDVDISNVLSRGVRMSDFEEAVTILSQNVGKVVLAMDTCHSGALSFGARSGAGGEDLVATLREASGLYILAAAKSGEESLEDERFKLVADDAGHGVFTYALLKGMSGNANYDGDGYISLHEIFQYVSKQVPRLTSGRQHPYYRAEGTDMPLIIIDN